MKFRISSSRKRRAAVAPMAALLMGFLVGMLAFSIDVGYICSVQAELQDAADAAALAGAQQLQSSFVAYFSPGQTNQQQIYNLAVSTDPKYTSSPSPTAQRFAQYNQAGGVYVSVPSSDVSLSYYDGTTFSAPSLANNLFPNTVTVTTRRDANANGSLSLFFAKVFGISNINLTATASATIYAGNITSLQVIPGVNAHILPVALDMYTWEAFTNSANYVNGQLSSTSPYLNGSVTTGSNGLPQLQVYPNSTNTLGSFGLIDVGVPSNNSPAFRNWINDGSTPNDISYLLNNSLLPVSITAPPSWKVGPGLKSTLLSNFQSVIGESNLIPLFQPYQAYNANLNPSYIAASGTGQNATYSVVGFVGVTVSQADGSGSAGMTISIQPAAIVDPTAVILGASPARASQQTVFGTPQTTFVSAKLTQ